MVTKDDLELFALRIQDSIDRLSSKIETVIKARHCIEGVLLYDNQDLLQMLRVSKSQLYLWRTSGKLKYKNFGGKNYYSPEEVQRFIREEL